MRFISIADVSVTGDLRQRVGFLERFAVYGVELLQGHITNRAIWRSTYDQLRQLNRNAHPVFTPKLKTDSATTWFVISSPRKRSQNSVL